MDNMWKETSPYTGFFNKFTSSHDLHNSRGTIIVLRIRMSLTFANVFFIKIEIGGTFFLNLLLTFRIKKLYMKDTNVFSDNVKDWLKEIIGHLHRTSFYYLSLIDC